MSWLTGSKPQICPTTNLSMESRRRYVAVLRKSLQRAVIDQRGLDALRTLIPELGPDGREPEFDE